VGPAQEMSIDRGGAQQEMRAMPRYQLTLEAGHRLA